jgi:serralysin
MAFTEQQIQGLYVAFFGRPADPAGLANWAASAGAYAELLNTFTGSAEYLEFFPDPSATKANVITLYHNLLGRTPSDTEANGWVADITDASKPDINLNSLAYHFLVNAGVEDTKVINAKIDVASELTAAWVANSSAFNGFATGGKPAGDLVRSWLGSITENTIITIGKDGAVAEAAGKIANLNTKLKALDDGSWPGGAAHVIVPVGNGLGSIAAGTFTGTGGSGNALSSGAKSVLGILGADTGLDTRWNYGEVVGGSNKAAGIGTGVTLTYSFLTSLPNYYYSSANNSMLARYAALETFTAAQKTATERILALISQVVDITFVKAPAGEVGDISFAKSEQSANALGHTYLPSFGWTTGAGGVVTSATPSAIGGDVWIGKNATWNRYEGNPWKDGGVGFGVLFHEIGHALGLKHTFGPSSATGVTLANDDPLNTTSHSIMSYTEAKDSFVAASGNIYYPLQPGTLMPFDIEALQYLYGAKATATGNNTYSWIDKPEILQTIWDAGGIDTIDASNQTGNCIINLNAGAYSSIGIRTPVSLPNGGGYTGKDNLAIAKNVVIENAKGGSGNDTLFANAANNRLEGGMGNDIYAGYKIGISTGHDTLYDIGGNDRIEIANARKDAGLGDVIISHSGSALVLTLSADSRITLEDFYHTCVIETLAGTNWDISLAGVANQLAEGEYTTLWDIFA